MGTTLQERFDWSEQAREADADPDFLVRMLALCSLPRTDQGARSRFVLPLSGLAVAASPGWAANAYKP